ncbi:protein of unknown function [Bradyrhizobium vignae]|uniref:Uncharacterized protein n=1 Tax=Bradyrhizobium vignae TaxID=1549949 RepID=A0A2U3Q001_9BRAD|nr:protein of unknown function [Bradyrhizobium vignae]
MRRRGATVRMNARLLQIARLTGRAAGLLFLRNERGIIRQAKADDAQTCTEIEKWLASRGLKPPR